MILLFRHAFYVICLDSQHIQPCRSIQPIWTNRNAALRSIAQHCAALRSIAQRRATLSGGELRPYPIVQDYWRRMDDKRHELNDYESTWRIISCILIYIYIYKIIYRYVIYLIYGIFYCMIYDLICYIIYYLILYLISYIILYVILFINFRTNRNAALRSTAQHCAALRSIA